MSPLRSLQVFAFALLAAAVPTVASAQIAQGPPTPLAVDLGKVPVGSSSQYSVTVGSMAPMTMKIGLVGRAAGGNTIETSIEGGIAARAGKMITQMTLPTGSGGKVQKMVLQLGSNDPMEMPIEGAQSQQFSKPDPKTLVKEETVKVAAGSYKTKHYHDKTPQGDTVDFWVSEKVLPIGLVKMEATQKSNPMIGGPIKMELTGSGNDAKSSITKAPKPFDQQAFMKQMMAGQAAAGAPPPATK
ncbi:MAG TPA: hypothetical protein VMT03_14720 [Polyangia bacterium]|nr:hypothetical protein [Polyangia bacterium]